MTQPVLGADAPEGTETVDETLEEFGDGKEVLSFCWRALKESR